MMLESGSPGLRAIDLFVSVAQFGSLGKAAAAHDLSQPALSMRMKQLEQTLGITLLKRESSGTRLTANGDAILSSCRSVLTEVGRLVSVADRLRADGDGRLRVAASFTVAEYLLPDWLRSLTNQSNQLSLTMEVMNTTSVLARLRGRQVEIGFTEGLADHHADLDEAIVGGDRLELVVSPDHPWAQRSDPVTGAELVSSDIITREVGSGTREVLEHALGPWGILRARVEMASTAAILDAARRCEGPAVLSAIAVAEDVRDGRLIAVTTDGLELGRNFRALWLSGEPMALLPRRLLDIATSGSDERPGTRSSGFKDGAHTSRD